MEYQVKWSDSEETFCNSKKAYDFAKNKMKSESMDVSIFIDGKEWVKFDVKEFYENSKRLITEWEETELSITFSHAHCNGKFWIEKFTDEFGEETLYHLKRYNITSFDLNKILDKVIMQMGE